MTGPSAEEIRHRTGRAIAVLVEGETDQNDAFFYKRWFSDLSNTFRFFPGDGCLALMESVGRLRAQIPDVPVFGILDRDFLEDGELQAFNAKVIENFILRTPRFTLENYLLEAKGWYLVLQDIFRRQSVAPVGWDTEDAVAKQINDSYCACLPLAAYNWVISVANQRYQKRRSYVESPAALAGRDIISDLTNWRHEIQVSEDLGQVYTGRLRRLEEVPQSEWAKFVSGKWVLRELHRRFPRRPGRGQFDLEHYENLYLDRVPDAPEDLRSLLETIRQTAGR